MQIQQQQTIGESIQLARLLPQIRALSAADKLQLLHFLTAELLHEAGLAALSHENQALRTSAEAASILATALAELLEHPGSWQERFRLSQSLHQLSKALS